MSKIQFFYYKAIHFQHFDYIYKLTREYKFRNFGEIPCDNIDTTVMPKDVILKIGIAGEFTDKNLKNKRCPITKEFFIIEIDCQ